MLWNLVQPPAVWHEFHPTSWLGDDPSFRNAEHGLLPSDRSVKIYKNGVKDNSESLQNEEDI